MQMACPEDSELSVEQSEGTKEELVSAVCLPC